MDIGSAVSLDAGDEISKRFFLVILRGDAFAQSVEVAIEIVIVDIWEEFECDLIEEVFGRMCASLAGQASFSSSLKFYLVRGWLTSYGLLMVSRFARG